VIDSWGWTHYQIAVEDAGWNRQLWLWTRSTSFTRKFWCMVLMSLADDLTRASVGCNT
jgi:hypothetical protein